MGLLMKNGPTLARAETQMRTTMTMMMVVVLRMTMTMRMAVMMICGHQQQEQQVVVGALAPVAGAASSTNVGQMYTQCTNVGHPNSGSQPPPLALQAAT